MYDRSYSTLWLAFVQLIVVYSTFVRVETVEDYWEWSIVTAANVGEVSVWVLLVRGHVDAGTPLVPGHRNSLQRTVHYKRVCILYKVGKISWLAKRDRSGIVFVIW